MLEIEDKIRQLNTTNKEVYLLLKNEIKPIILSSPHIKEIPHRYKGIEHLEYIELQMIGLDELINLNEKLRTITSIDKISSYRWSTDAVESCDIFQIEAQIHYNHKLHRVTEIITATMKDKSYLYHQLAFRILGNKRG